MTTTQTVEGRTITEYSGIVVGEAIMGANVVRDFFAGITDIIGGRSGARARKGTGSATGSTATDTVATRRPTASGGEGAIGGASVAVGSVAIVALFTSIHCTISTLSLFFWCLALYSFLPCLFCWPQCIYIWRGRLLQVRRRSCFPINRGMILHPLGRLGQ